MVSVGSVEIGVSIAQRELDAGLRLLEQRLANVGNISIKPTLATAELQQGINRLREELEALNNVKIAPQIPNVPLPSNSGGTQQPPIPPSSTPAAKDATDLLSSLQSQVLTAQSRLEIDKQLSLELQKQASLVQEQSRYRQQLASIEKSGLSDDDTARAKDLAQALNSINLSKIEQDFQRVTRAAQEFKDASGAINALQSQALRGAASVEGDRQRSAELQRQAALLDEQVRFKQQLEGLEGAGFSAQDTARAKELAQAINSTNLQKIESEFQQASAAARELANQSSGLKNALQGIAQGVGQGLVGFAGNALQNAIQGITGLAQGVLAVGSAAQESEISFSTFLGSVEAGQAAVADLRQFAATTPFEFPEVRAAGQQLIAFGISANDLTATLRRVGDIAAGTGVPIQELTAIYGKARTQGRLFAEDINQLRGRGIPITEELAKQFGVAESEVAKLVEQGKVGFPQLEQAFASLTSEGGRFAGLMQNLSESIPGQLSNLADSFTEVQRQAFEAISPAIAGSISLISGTLKEAGSQVVGIDALTESTERLSAALTESGAARELGTALAALVNEAIDEAIAAVQGLTNTLRENPRAIASFVSSIGSLGSLVISLVGSVVRLIAALQKINPLGGVLARVFGIAGDAFRIISRVGEGLVGIVSNIINGFQAFSGIQIPNPFGLVLSTVESLVARVKELLGISDKLRPGLGDAVSGFAEGNDQVQNLLPNESPTTQTGTTPTNEDRVKAFEAEIDRIATLREQENNREIAAVRQLQADRIITEQDAAQRILDIRRSALDAELAANQSQIDQINQLKEAGVFNEEEAQKRIQALQTEATALQLQQVEALIDAQEQLKRAALDRIQAENQRIETQNSIDTTNDIRAVRQLQQQRVISARDAEDQIAAIRRQSLAAEIAENQRQVGEISRLRSEGILSQQDAQDELLKLEEERSQLGLEAVESQIEAEQRLIEAKNRAIQEELQGRQQIAQLEAQISGQGLTNELNLLNARNSLIQAQTDLTQTRLQAQLQEAEAENRTYRVEQLREQIQQNQVRQLQAQQEAEVQQLRLKERQLELDQQQAQLTAEIAAVEAEIAIQQAEANGATAEQIANLERIAELRRQQQDLVEGQAAAQEELNRLARAELAVRQENAREAQRAAQEAEDRRAEEERRNGSSNGSGRGTSIQAVGGTQIAQLNEARRIVDEARDSLSGTADLISRITAGTNPFIEQLLALQGGQGVLNLAALAQGTGSQRAQAFQAAAAIDSGSITQDQVNALTSEIRRLANSPRQLNVSAPDPIAATNSILGQISRNSAGAAGL